MARPKTYARTGASLIDVARLAGVSVQTVSRTLRSPEKVASKTREKVLACVKELGYIPNASARNLVSQSSRIVVVIIPTLTSSTYAIQVSSIMDIMESHGISTVVGNSEYSPEREERLIFSLLQYRPMGFILTGMHHTPRCAELLRLSGAPVVETWEIDGDPLGLAVGFSNVEAGRELGRELLRRGSRQVAFVRGDDSRAVARAKGLRLALAEAGLEPSVDLEYRTPMAVDIGLVGSEEVLAKAPHTDTIFFSADFLALGALSICQSRGVRVPEDIAFCGFGDHELSPFIMPGLTTVKLFPEEMGKRSAEAILNNDFATIQNTPQAERIIRVPYEIVRRGST